MGFVGIRRTKGVGEEEKSYRRAVNAWVLYDFANSAFATTVMTVFMPVYYVSVAGNSLPGNVATAYWGYTISIALAIAAVLSPVLGAMADLKGRKKRYLGYFVVLGVSGTALLFFVGEGKWLMGSVIFILANIGFASANVFYDALLPHVAKEGDGDRVSARGFAIGYVGGGLMLAINLATIYFFPEHQDFLIRLAFLCVAVWWLVFTIPLWRMVPEPPRHVTADEIGINPVRAGFRRLGATAREVAKYKEVLKYLIALLIYTDAIGTITKMGVTFAAEVGIEAQTIAIVVLVIQFVSVPFAFAFGWLAGKIGTKRAIYLGLAIYICSTIGAYRMQNATHFWIVGMLVAMAQGGTASMTRSLGARMIPKSKSGEFFGFVSVMVKFAGIIGPALFGIIAQVMGSSRLGFLSLTAFFLVGIVILASVDENEAMAVAREEDARLAAVSSQ